MRGICNPGQPPATPDASLVMSRSAVRARSSAFFLSQFSRKAAESREVSAPRLVPALEGMSVLARSADHDDRALGMSRDVLGYRPQEHPGEPAKAARADHEQIGVRGEVDEQFGCVALLDLRMHEDRGILAEDVMNRFHQQLFRRLPGIGCS